MKKNNLIKLLILVLGLAIVSLFLFSKTDNVQFTLESTLLFSFFGIIILFSKDYLNPFMFYLLFSFLGFLDIILVVIGIRQVSFNHSIGIYNKSLLLMIIWFIFFSLGYFIINAKKNNKKELKKEKNKEREFDIDSNVALFFGIVVVLLVIVKVFGSFSTAGGIYNAFFNPKFKIFSDQNYLSMFMALCGIIPVLFLKKGKTKSAIITMILVFLLMSLTKRRTLALVYSLVPFAVYYNYKVKKIKLKHLVFLLIPLSAYVLIIGEIRGVSEGTSNSVENKLVENVADITRQIEYGKNLPDLIYSIDTHKIEFQHFKYFFNGIITYIPRGVWPNKPLVESASIVSKLIYTKSTNVAGHPVGPYGWSYLLFGYLGVIILGFLNGIIVALFFNWIKCKDNLFCYLIYAYSILKMLEFFAPESQFKISFFIIVLFILAFMSKIYRDRWYNAKKIKKVI